MELFIMGVQANHLYISNQGKNAKKTRPIHILRNHFLVLQFFYIVLHTFYTEASCLNGYGWTCIRGRSKPLIYLKSEKKCEKTRPIHLLRNHFLVLQFFYIVFHTFYTDDKCRV